MAGRLTRKRFLGRTGSLLALAAFPAACGDKKIVYGTTTATTTATTTGGATLTVYRLTTDDGKCTGTRCSCGACARHAANKLFASRDAADQKRAHPHCNCGIVSEELPRERWTSLFGDPGAPGRTLVDRRDPAVQKLLS